VPAGSWTRGQFEATALCEVQRTQQSRQHRDSGHSQDWQPGAIMAGKLNASQCLQHQFGFSRMSSLERIRETDLGFLGPAGRSKEEAASRPPQPPPHLQFMTLRPPTPIQCLSWRNNWPLRASDSRQRLAVASERAAFCLPCITAVPSVEPAFTSSDSGQARSCA